MNETCSKCGAPLDTDGCCSYHQSRTPQKYTPAPQAISTGQSALDEIEAQGSIATTDLVSLMFILWFFAAMVYDLLGGTFELFPVTLPALLLAQVIKLITGISLMVVCWKRERHIFIVLWVGNILFTLVRLGSLLMD